MLKIKTMEKSLQKNKFTLYNALSVEILKFILKFDT